MKFKIILITFFLFSCSSISSSNYKKNSFSSKGFAYIYDIKDYENKIIKKKINSDNFIIGHHTLKRGTLIKISNPVSGKNIIAKNEYKLDYPNFYNILVTKSVAQKLDLNFDIPYVEIEEIKKNKSFIAKKADIFDEEKQIHSSAPVEKVSISNISKKKEKKKIKKQKFTIILGNFYSLDSAKNLVKKVKKDSLLLRDKKISIFKRKEHNYEVFLGPYKTIKKIKNDYIALQQINFEEIDVKLND